MAKSKKAQNVPDLVTPDSTRATPASPTSSPSWVWAAIARAVLFVYFAYVAVTIRLFAVINYGRIIHEFDPWFNYRATEYLVAHGYSEFVKWFDYESWYPIGRPVGTTIYPGMMITASGIYHTLNALGFEVSVNDVCVFIPAGFAALTISFMYLLTLECTSSHNMAIVATGIMAIIPAHLMRSVAGGYDNESVAMCLIISTFFFWVRSLRNDQSWWVGVLAGLSYAAMAATWGAYTYVLNLIALHAGVLIVTGRFSQKLHRAYSLFFVVGTAGALQFPIVGWQPFDSMEQISALLVFGLMQAVFLFNIARKNVDLKPQQVRALVIYGGILAVLVGAFALNYALNAGILLPVTARVRGLFVQHTKTGNPLVDSVAEHQSTPPDVYVTYFGFVSLAAPIGFVVSFFVLPFTDSLWFFWLYFLTAGYFSQKMIRLVLLLAPPATIAGSILITLILEWTFAVLTGSEPPPEESEVKNPKRKAANVARNDVFEIAERKYRDVSRQFRQMELLRMGIAAGLFLFLLFQFGGFYSHSVILAERFSEPQIILRGRGRDGNPIIVDDFREAYFWLRDNTPTDSRVMAWWDYGYQINGVANRTSIADGNTWNHEHIALLGKALISPERESHKITRHLADYVLVWSTRWAGMMGDDLAKCPHMARIAGSVFFDVPWKEFYMMGNNEPTPALSKSLLYQLINTGIKPGVPKPKYFDEAYTTKNRMVRIFKVKDVSEESKRYAAEHHTYPPALEPILAQSNRFERDREKQFLNL